MFCSVFLFLNLGGGEVVLVIFVIVMLFGSDKLPGLAKGLGKGLRELNDAKAQIQNEIYKNTDGLREEIKKHTSDIKSEFEKAGEATKQRLDDVSKIVKDEGKNIEDTLK